MFNNLLRQRVINIHHGGRTRNAHAPILFHDFATRGAFTRLHIVHVIHKGIPNLVSGRQPEFVAVEIAFHIHVGGIGQGILRQDKHIRSVADGVHHVSRHKTSRVGAAKEERMGFQWWRIEGVWKGFFVGVEFGQNGLCTIQHVGAVLPTVVVPGLFGRAHAMDEFVIACIFNHRHNGNHAGQRRSAPETTLAPPFDRHDKSDGQPVSNPQGEDAVGGDKLDLLDKAVL